MISVEEGNGEKSTMDQQLIFLDIDGTLTEAGCNVPPDSALTAVKRAQRGHKVFLCTGRNYDMLKPLLQYGFDGVVASAGGYVRYEDEVIYDCPMTSKQQRMAMDIFEEHDIFRTIECLDGSYTDESFKEYLRNMKNQPGSSELLRWREMVEKELNILPMSQYENQPVYKIVFMCENEKQLIEPRAVLESEFEFCIQPSYGNGILNGELINRKFDKGQGMEKICELMDKSMEDTMAFGDSMNDRAMMESAGISVCMADGASEIKRMADDICPAVTADGIYYAFMNMV